MEKCVTFLFLTVSSLGCAVNDLNTVEDLQQASWANLGSAVGNGVASGSTRQAANETAPVCAVSSSPDHSYSWTAPSTGTYTITTAGSQFDTVLQLRHFTTNHSGASLGCNDDAGGTLQSSVSVAVSAGQGVEITVDGYGSNRSGNYVLNITMSAGGQCPGGCNSPPGQCYNSPGTCSNGTCVYGYKSAGAPCSDGFSCTSGDQCDGAGSCSGMSTCSGGSECTSQGCCEPYNESYCDSISSCEVSSSYVQCGDGMTMYAWRTPDCRWCINRDACDAHMGPVVCPL